MTAMKNGELRSKEVIFRINMTNYGQWVVFSFHLHDLFIEYSSIPVIY